MNDYTATSCNHPIITWLALFMVSLLLSACGGGGGGGGGSSSSTNTSTTASTYSIGGTVSGLAAGATVTLYNNPLSDNTGDSLSVNANGSFSFSKPISSGSTYYVTVSTQPSGQTCRVSNGFGTATANITNISVTCTSSSSSFSIGGTVSGLAAGQTVTLQLNESADTQTVTGIATGTDVNFTFSKKAANTNAYAVSVKTHPVGATCSLGSGSSGTIATADVTNIKVTCTAVSTSAIIRAVDVVQTLSQPADSTYQLLVPGRAAQVRAFVYKNTGTLPSNVTLSVNDAAAVSMTCPGTLPTDSGAGAPIHVYNNDTVCYSNLDASQVKSGLKLVVSAGVGASQTVKPAVNSKSTLNIVIVPLIINGKTATVGDLTTIKNYLLKRFPLKDITLTQRAAYTPSGTYSDNLSGSSDWESVLSRIDDLRSAETANAIYYAMVPLVGTFGTGTIGLGYVGQGSATSAMGFDSTFTSDSSRWDQTMAHEIAHTLSLLHAPCGNPVSVDSFWRTTLQPWTDASSGKLSAAAIVDDNDTLVDPAETGLSSDKGYDIMGYCGGLWFSTYNYNKIAKYLRDNSIAAATLAAQNTTSASTKLPLLRISGRINAAGVVSLNPIDASSGFTPGSNHGTHVLRLQTRGGSFIEQRFTPLEVADSPSAVKHFAVNLENPGEISQISVLHNNVVLDSLAAQAHTVSGTTDNRIAANQSISENLSLTENAGVLRVQWNTAQNPWLSISHIASDGTRQGLRLRAEGGSLTLPVAHLPLGGRWEITQSNGLNVKVSTQTRLTP